MVSEMLDDDAINIVALVKDGEIYTFTFTDARRTEALHTVGRFAADRELSLTWLDATRLSRTIRQETW